MPHYWLNFALVTITNFVLNHRIADSTTDLLCPKCGEDKHAMKHWFTSRPVLSSTRLELIGSVDVSLNLLSLQPAMSVAMAKKKTV